MRRSAPGGGRPSRRRPSAPKASGVPAELSEQLVLARQLDAARLLWCHVPNGGYRSHREAGLLKASGVKAGVPDVLVFTPPPKLPAARGVALELKALDGSLAEEQRGWLEALAAAGWATVVAYGAADAVAHLRAMGYAL